MESEATEAQQQMVRTNAPGIERREAIAGVLLLLAAASYLVWTFFAARSPAPPPGFVLDWRTPTSLALLAVGIAFAYRSIARYFQAGGLLLSSTTYLFFVVRNGWSVPFQVMGIRYPIWLVAPALAGVGAILILVRQTETLGWRLASMALAGYVAVGSITDWGPQGAPLSPEGTAYVVHVLLANLGYLAMAYCLWRRG